MTKPEDAAFRQALQSEARPLIHELERRGARFELKAGEVEIRPARLITAEERAVLRANRDDVLFLVEHRSHWYDWASAPVPSWADALRKGPFLNNEEQAARGSPPVSELLAQVRTALEAPPREPTLPTPSTTTTEPTRPTTPESMTSTTSEPTQPAAAPVAPVPSAPLGASAMLTTSALIEPEKWWVGADLPPRATGWPTRFTSAATSNAEEPSAWWDATTTPPETQPLSGRVEPSDWWNGWRGCRFATINDEAGS